VRRTFVEMLPLDGETESGREGRRCAIDEEIAKRWVLKPSLEGGGHNVHGAEIPEFLSRTPPVRWADYILQRRIESPEQTGILMSPRGVYEGEVVSELGVLGASLWKEGDEGGMETLENWDDGEDGAQAGWTFKSKPSDIKEMSVVKGYGCFGSPWLVDDEKIPKLES
jgi:glutathione synthase